MTTTTLADPDPTCSGCGARAGSCKVRTWLSGRSCCSSCTGPRSHVHHDEPGGTACRCRSPPSSTPATTIPRRGRAAMRANGSPVSIVAPGVHTATRTMVKAL